MNIYPQSNEWCKSQITYINARQHAALDRDSWNTLSRHEMHQFFEYVNAVTYVLASQARHCQCESAHKFAEADRGNRPVLAGVQDALL